MTEFEGLRIPICPYWKAFVVHQYDERYRILALCGRAKNEGPNIEDTDLGPRLKVCPDDGIKDLRRVWLYHVQKFQQEKN